MPADAISGLAEAVAALMQAMVEALVLIIELVIELVFLFVELVLFLIGRSHRMGRPGWVVRRRQSPAGRIKSLVVAVLFLAAGGFAAFQYFGYTRLSFSHNGFTRPDSVGVMLVRGESTQVAMIENRKLKVRRGRWDRIEILDPRYQASGFDISGRRMDLRLEKIQTIRKAATEAVIDKAAELLRQKIRPGRGSKRERIRNNEIIETSRKLDHCFIDCEPRRERSGHPQMPLKFRPFRPFRYSPPHPR
jgi:hypothetical protein